MLGPEKNLMLGPEKNQVAIFFDKMTCFNNEMINQCYYYLYVSKHNSEGKTVKTMIKR